MSWSQWPGGAAQQPPVVAAAAPLINPAPSVMPPGLPYSTDQYSQMQQQNWQQWAQWQQQYQQWHQQYGAEYQKSMNALATQAVAPNMGVPPPLPVEAQPQPPLPQEEVPKPAPPLPGVLATPQQPTLSQYSTQPPPTNNFSAPPPNFTPNRTQPDWRGGDTAALDQKRGLGPADESANKRQMINRQGWRNQNSAGPPPAPSPAQSGQGQNETKLEELSEAEKKFDKQFAEWEAQFNKWKDQNSGHPDKQQYKEYEKKWEQWRQQLLERREAMRKKRLGLTGANKGTPTQNFNVPPPTQAQGSYSTQPPPVIPPGLPPQRTPLLPTPNAIPPNKEILKDGPNLFNKPPPDMNDEPLQFKNAEHEPEESEGSLGFLNTERSEGIPGLDLVKDGNLETKEDEVEEVPQKGPDFDAISKGINNILGDQKLMNMLSMVSQNQNINPNTNISKTSKVNDTFPNQDQSNLSADDSRNEPFGQSETVQNFDDQTRSSFTMQPSDSDVYRGGPPVNQMNRNNFDSEHHSNRGPSNDRFENRPFGGPMDEAFRRLPPNSRFGREIDAPVDDFDSNKNQFMNRNSDNFDRPPPGHMNRNATNFDRPPPGNIGRDDFAPRFPPGPQGQGRRDMFGPPGPNNMNKNSLIPGLMDKSPFGSQGSLNRDQFGKDQFSSPGQGNLNRDKFSPGMNRDDFKNSFGSGPMDKAPFGAQRIPNRDHLGNVMNENDLPPSQGNLNRDKFGPGINRDDFSPANQANLGRDKFGPGMNRDNFPSLAPGNQTRDNLGGPPGPGGINRSRLEPPPRGNVDRGNFESDNFNRDNFGRNNPNSSNLGGRPFEDKFEPRGGANFGGRRDSRCEEFDYNNDDFEEAPADRFTRGPQNQRFEDGPAGRRGPSFNDRRDFDRMPPNMRSNESGPFRNDGKPFNRDNLGPRDDFDARCESRMGDRPPFNRGSMGHEPERFENRGNIPPLLGVKFSPRDQPNLREERGPFPRDNFGRGNFRDEDDYPPPPPLFGSEGPNNYRDGPLQRRDSLGNSMMDAPEPPPLNRDSFDDRFDNDYCEDQFDPDAPENDLESEVPPSDPCDDNIWKPASVIDYDHKTLNAPELDILVEPFRMFDYRHKSLKRIPFPERPNWLSDSVRMIPEFDPPIIRPPAMDRRLFEGRFEPPPQRRDERDDYEISRIDDRYRYERRGYGRDLSPPHSRIDARGRGYEEDSWSSRRNRSRSPKFERSPPRFERSPPRFERERVDRGRNRSRDRTDRERGRDWEGRDNDWENENDRRGGSKDWKGENNWKDKGRDYKEGNREDNWKNKNKDWEERGRQWEEDDMDLSDREKSKERDLKYRQDRNVDRDFEREKFNKKSAGQIFPLSNPAETKLSNVTLIEDIINSPGRSDRPARIVIILRGPPGSGKTFLAKLIKDKEVENGGSAPRILSLDDYFMVEQEKEVMEDGKRIKMKDMVYEFEAEMEESYRTSLMRSFKKTITDGYFPFIIVDNVNDKVKYFGEMWSFAKQNGFQVYICQMDLDVQNCIKRNIHNRSEDEIRKCVNGWEKTPAHHPTLDATALLQEELIPMVEMEEINSPGSVHNDNEEGLEDHLDRSKWDTFDCSINNLARLDGVNKPLRPSRTMEEYLQLDDEWQPPKSAKPGQKRVRWADLEERKQQEKMRAIGFVVGQTDWDRMMDPTMGEGALTKTKYIEKEQRRRF